MEKTNTELLKLLKENGIIEFENEKDNYPKIKFVEDSNEIIIQNLDFEDSFMDIYVYYFNGNNFDRGFDLDNVVGKLDETKDRVTRLVLIFDNWEKERDYLLNIKKSSMPVKEKNMIKKIFSGSEKIYVNAEQILKLKVDKDGINYLENPERKVEFEKSENPESEISGFVVNCNFYELKKVYNVTGSMLFKRNVRNGIEKNKAIRNIFNQYFPDFSVDNYVSSLSPESNELKNIIEKAYDANLFWYSHNGITLFVSSEIENGYKFENNEIIINPKAISVINGAQTITNMFDIYSEKKFELEKLKETNKEKYDEYNQELDNLLKNINVKLTFIIANSAIADYVTKGLNTQIPINYEDFVANTEEVEIINKASKGRLKIQKTGEFLGDFYGEIQISALQFVKKVLVLEEQPGKSKNFNKDNISDELKVFIDHYIEMISKKESEKEISIPILNKDGEKIIRQISELNEIETWWKKRIREIKEKSIVDRYGNLYFQSFFINKRDSEEINNEILEYYYIMFKKICDELGTIDASDFKKDALFEKIINYNMNNDISKQIIENELKDYMNGVEDTSDYAKITKYLVDKKIEFDHIKTIRVQDGKILDSFQLDQVSFSSLYQSENFDIKSIVEGKKQVSKTDFPEFLDSKLYEELIKKYTLFLVFQEKGSVSKVELLKDFQFHILDEENYDENIKSIENIYEQTILAFVEGDRYGFPKLQDENLIFVRPVSSDKHDKFLFTDGSELPKQTFWINNKYLEEKEFS
ncbi:AIPR family protein [Granulicatella sp. UMB5615A]|jgi:AIPR protein.|uniref:AIPR family protein n=1 Tax=Granulicatella sp. UMB5615A TaxID=3050606 RepID=UPI0025572C7F|nr:AIPR family protein [Granulicatella sp. UMB5615A]MDK8523132.1 AIPR family protein [Granulicatella sp. UMB5615A]